MNTNQLTNEIAIIDYESYFDWRAGEVEQITVFGKYLSNSHKYQHMMENLEFTVVRITNLPDGWKSIVHFTDPLDSELGQPINPRISIYAMCNWQAKEITSDWVI